MQNCTLNKKYVNVFPKRAVFRYNCFVSHTLPSLSYSYSALEPFIDARTMEIHHTKHHAAYVEKLNAALEKYPALAEKPLEELLKDLANIPEDIRTAVRNHGGGHSNHSLFWTIMAPPAQGGGGEPSGEFNEAIARAFGDFAGFQKQFTSAAIGVFGSGWAWLVKDAEGSIKIVSTPNQDSPLSGGMTPILGVDVWEHAYYVKYLNRRADYLAAWWNVVKWEEVGQRYSGFLLAQE